MGLNYQWRAGKCLTTDFPGRGVWVKGLDLWSLLISVIQILPP